MAAGNDKGGTPVRVEVRMNGKVMFSQDCYSPELKLDKGKLRLSASVEAPSLSTAVQTRRPPERFQDDPRNSDTVIQQVHSGSRKAQVAAPSPKRDTT